MKQSDYLSEERNLIVDLKELPIFASLGDEDLRHLQRMSRLRMFAPGETIVEEGRDDAWIYFLIYGKVKIVKHNREISVVDKGGDVFGEMGFIDGSPRCASAYADGDTVCLALDSAYLENLSGEDKFSLGYVLYRILSVILAEKLREATAELVALKGSSGVQFWERT